MSAGKFDAAINCLSVMADRDFANGAPHRGQFRAAIRVLEAAGKVDKKKAIAVYDRMEVPDSSRFTKKELRDVAIEIDSQIYALLDALPDAPEGGKG